MSALAIFTPQLGTVSETFIRRHIEDLSPGNTVVIAKRSDPPAGGRWVAPCPVLYLNHIALKPSVRLARRLGLSVDNIVEAAIARFLKRHHVTTILIEYLNEFVDFVPEFQRLRIPFIVQGHGIDLSAALHQEGMSEKYARYASSRAVLTRCEFHRQRLVALGLPPDLIKVNPGGIDIPDELPRKPVRAIKRVLAVGRMTGKKAPIILLEAFRRAAATDHDIHLDYIGGGELLPAAKQFVRACNLEARVRLHGAASEDFKEEMLRQCGVFVQHSVTDPETGDEEGLPAAVQEAMASGLVVIGSKHSGIPEAVEDGHTGLITEEGNVDQLTSAILRVASDPCLCEKLAANAYQKAKELYSWKAERERLSRFIL